MPAADPARRTIPVHAYPLMAAVSFFWGINWPFMKLAVAEIPPWSFRAACLAIGAAGLFAIAAAAGQRLRPAPGELWPLIVSAMFNVFGWLLLSAYGVALMAGGRATIIGYTMPLWVTLMSAAWLGEALTLRKLLALALGLTGLGLLFWREVGTLEAAPWGALCMLLGAVSWGIGTVLIKRVRWHLRPMPFTAWQLMVAGVPLIPGALLVDGLPSLGHLSTTGALCALYAATVPILFCQTGWYSILRVMPASIASIASLINPVIGVYACWLILGEPMGWAETLALALVVGAMAVVLLEPRRRA